MNGLYNGWMGYMIDEWLNWWMNGLYDGWMVELMDQWMNWWINGWHLYDHKIYRTTLLCVVHVVNVHVHVFLHVKLSLYSML